ncbi:unnamed protein product [Dicrocoelium dendriticum]|nr:unnamed protein product [Dicrocoelium dendriticum]
MYNEKLPMDLKKSALLEKRLNVRSTKANSLTSRNGLPQKMRTSDKTDESLSLGIGKQNAQKTDSPLMCDACGYSRSGSYLIPKSMHYENLETSEGSTISSGKLDDQFEMSSIWPDKMQKRWYYRTATQSSWETTMCVPLHDTKFLSGNGIILEKQASLGGFTCKLPKLESYTDQSCISREIPSFKQRTACDIIVRNLPSEMSQTVTSAVAKAQSLPRAYTNAFRWMSDDECLQNNVMKMITLEKAKLEECLLVKGFLESINFLNFLDLKAEERQTQLSYQLKIGNLMVSLLCPTEIHRQNFFFQTTHLRHCLLA